MSPTAGIKLKAVFHVANMRLFEHGPGTFGRSKLSPKASFALEEAKMREFRNGRNGADFAPSGCGDRSAVSYRSGSASSGKVCLVRLASIMDDAAAKGANLNWVPEQPARGSTSTRFPFAIATDVSPDMRIMQEEIFGPALAVLEYETVSEALDFIARNPHPLSASYFGNDDAERAQVVDRVQTGSVVVNDVRIQLFYEALPFGGVGHSGIGRYRGYEGFKTFSNMKTIVHQIASEAALAAQRPPFGDAAYAKASSILEALRARSTES